MNSLVLLFVVVQYRLSYSAIGRTFEVTAHYTMMDQGFARVVLNPKVGAPFYYFGKFFLKTA